MCAPGLSERQTTGNKSALTWPDWSCSGKRAAGEIDDARAKRRDILGYAGLLAIMLEFRR